jgi:adenylylsulfate kinase
MDTNIVWHHATVTRERRNQQNNHKSVVLWFTGLSGSGKSTLAHAVEEQLHQQGCRTFVLDGDNVRHGLNGDLGFSHEDRKENLRRVGEVSKLFIEAGTIVLTAFISPFREERKKIRSMMPHGDFFEIYVDCPIEVCEKRDVKGLYKRARVGEVKEFTGVSSPYEIPENAELAVNTDQQILEGSVDRVINLLITRGIL